MEDSSISQNITKGKVETSAAVPTSEPLQRESTSNKNIKQNTAELGQSENKEYKSNKNNTIDELESMEIEFVKDDTISANQNTSDFEKKEQPAMMTMTQKKEDTKTNDERELVTSSSSASDNNKSSKPSPEGDHPDGEESTTNVDDPKYLGDLESNIEEENHKEENGANDSFDADNDNFDTDKANFDTDKNNAEKKDGVGVEEDDAKPKRKKQVSINTTVTAVKGPTITPEVGDEDWITPVVGLTTAEVEESRDKFGLNAVPVHVTPTYIIFLRQFVGFLPVLIELAAIISLAAQDYPDFAIIVIILLVNACLGFHEEYKAKMALDELANSMVSSITVVRNGEAQTISVTDLVPGDLILMVGGTAVPADVKWIKGDIMDIDTAALTGEPLPRKYPSEEYGDIILSGCTVRNGECYAQIVATGTNTEIGQAQADIFQDKSVRVVPVFQRKIMVIVQMLVTASLALVVSVVLVIGVAYDGFGKHTRDTILDGLAILIASIPIALPLVIQVNLALGASHLAKHHAAIVTSIPALQDIASMCILCSDKTGTLTTAQMSVISEMIYPVGEYSPQELLLYAYLTSNADKKHDPIDKAIITAYEESTIGHAAQKLRKDGSYHQESLIGFNPEVKRVISFISKAGEGGGSDTITVAKGLPAKIMNTEAGGIDDGEIQWKIRNFDDKNFIADITSHDTAMSRSGYKTIAIAICKSDAREEGDHVWELVGLLPMLDPPREDTAQTIESLHRANISVKMITGDHVNVGKETARLIGLGTDIQAGEDIRKASSEEAKNELIWNADGFASVLPSDKRDVVLTLRQKFRVVTGMTGDGVNDAPALSAAHVGIAVEGATDAAKNAADLILTKPGLSPIYGAVIASRRIFARIKSYVIYRVAASAVLVLVLSLLIFITGCAIDSLLVIILALLNDISMIPVAYDNAAATKSPETPRVKKLLMQSLFFGLVNASLTLAFIFGLEKADDLKQPISFTECDSESKMFVWLQLVFVTELMIFSTRAPNFMFMHPHPSIWLILSVGGTLLLGILVAVLSSDGLNGATVGWIMLFNFVSLIVVDLVKVWFKELIDEAAGEVIESEEIVSLDEVAASLVQKSDIDVHMNKQRRAKVHRTAAMQNDDQEHEMQIVNNKITWRNFFCSAFREMRLTTISDGYIFGDKRNKAAAEGSFRRNQAPSSSRSRAPSSLRSRAPSSSRSRPPSSSKMSDV
ncbi:hypothetical protein ACA910_001855 [Epithemia clementina (nom. ined.)]